MGNFKRHLSEDRSGFQDKLNEVTQKSRPTLEPKSLHQAAYQVLFRSFLKLPRRTPCQGGPKWLTNRNSKLPQNARLIGLLPLVEAKRSLNPPTLTPKSLLRLKQQLVKTAISGLKRNQPLTSPKGRFWLGSLPRKVAHP